MAGRFVRSVRNTLAVSMSAAVLGMTRESDNMAIRLDDIELSALEGVTHAAFVLYVKLRKRMDYATSYVGKRQGAGISWQALREELFIEPGPGLSGTGAPHKSAVIRLVKRLRRAGLVNDETVPGSYRLVFRLPLALADNSASKQPDTKPTHLSRDNESPLYGAQLGDSYVYCEGDQAQPETPQPGTHPVSGNTIKNKAPIPLDFCPSEETKVRCYRAGTPPVTGDEVQIFIAHQVANGKYSEDWEASFYGWMLMAKKFAANAAIKVSRGTNKPASEAWELMPVKDNKLMDWAKLHGFRKPNFKETEYEYRKGLEGEVRRRRDKQEKDRSPK